MPEDGLYTIEQLRDFQEPEAVRPIRSGDILTLEQLRMHQDIGAQDRDFDEVMDDLRMSEIAEFGLDNDLKDSLPGLPEKFREKILDMVKAKPEHIESLRFVRDRIEKEAAAKALVGVEDDPETQAGALKHLTHPITETYRNVANTPMRMRLRELTKEIVAAEAEWRLEHGFFDPETDIGEAAVGLDTGKVTKHEPPDKPYRTTLGQRRPLRKPSPYAKNNRWFREVIRRDLMNGIPMMAPDNDGKVQILYEEMAKIAPEQIPGAKTIMEKIASVGGNVGVLVAELAIAKKLLSTGKFSDRVTGRLPSALKGPAELGMEFGAVEAAHGRDAGKGAVTGIGLGAAGKIGSAVARGAKAAKATPKAMQRASQVGAVSGQAAFFGTQAAVAGGGLDDILIAAAIAPLLFKAKDVIYRRFSPSEALRGAREDFRNAPQSWRGLKDSTHKASKLIYRWHEFAETGGKEAEIRGIAKELQNLYKTYTKNDWKGVSKTERAIFENFLDIFKPEAVAERARERAEEAKKPEPKPKPVEAKVTKVKAKAPEPEPTKAIVVRPQQPPAEPAAAPEVLKKGRAVGGGGAYQYRTQEQAIQSYRIVSRLESRLNPLLEERGDDWVITVDDAQEPVTSAPEAAKKPVVGATEAERVRSEADDEPGADMLGAGIIPPGLLGPGKARRPYVAVPEAEFPDSAVQERREAAYGQAPVPTLEKLTAIATDAWHMATRARKHIPNNEEFAVANEVMRLWNDVPGQVAERVQRDVAAILDPMGPSELVVFEGAIQAENIIASMERGLGLPFGIKSEADVVSWRENLQKIIDLPENEAIRTAIASRKAVATELVGDLVKHGIMGAETLDNVDTYYHQQVLGYALMEGYGQRMGLKRKKASFQKRRTLFRDEETDSFYDWNTSFIEAETKWMTEARTKLRAEETLKTLADNYDIAPRLKRDASRLNYVNFVGGSKTMARIEEIRDILGNARDGVIDLDRQEAAALGEELGELDPTQGFRQKIAIATKRIEGWLKDGTIDTKAFDDLQPLSETDEYMDGRWFELLRYVGTKYADADPGIAALTVFKAIADRNAMIREGVGRKFRTWQDLVPAGHMDWQPENGNVFYRAYTIPEQLAEHILRNEAEEVRVAPGQIREAIALGGRRPSYVMPEEIVLQLNDMDKPQPRGPLAMASKETMTMWKVWTLMKHKTVMPYMLRNATGDLDPVLGGAMKALVYVPNAINVLRKHYYGNQLSVPPRLQSAIDNAVLSATMRRQELPDLKNLILFRRFYKSKVRVRDLPARTIGLYFDTVGKFNEFREGILRYALYEYALDIWDAGKEIHHYGGAKKVVVDRLRKDMGNEVAAAHYSRNFMIDYGNLTVMGQWARTHAIPFFSWLEGNTKRFPRLLINANEYGKAKGKGRAWARGMYTAGAMTSLASMTAALWAWNNLYRGDEEDDLGHNTASNPHINLGRLPDGQVRVFRNVGAVGDVLEWFGLNTYLNLQDEYRDGTLSGEDLLTEMLKDPVNKLVQGIRPDLKGAVEGLTGLSHYPDVFNPRRQPRGEVIPRALGLIDEYRWAKGKIEKEGDRPRKYYTSRHLFGVTDPRQNALFSMYDLRERYLRNEGHQGRGDAIYNISPMRNMRQAAIQEDYGAFKEARDKYMLAKDYESFRRSLAHLDPISQKLKPEDEIKFESEFLNDRQRLKLKMARDYAAELEIRLWKWWNRAAEEAGGDQAATSIEDLKTEMRPKLRTLSRVKPLKPEKRDKWKSDVANAFQYLKHREIGRKEATRQFYADLKERIKGRDRRSRKAKAGHRRRFRRAIAKLDAE